MTAIPTGEIAEGISWEVINRFRLLAGEDEETRFYRNLSAYIVEYEAWYAAKPSRLFLNPLRADLLHAEESDGRVQRPNFATHYNATSASYRCRDAGTPLCSHAEAHTSNWSTSRGRDVRLRASYFAGQLCRWTIDGTVARAPCDEHVISVIVDKPVPISVVPVRGGPSYETTVVVTDFRLVAMGDSFSSGEGVPHAQWRYTTLRGADAPALWLDARCHRSLLSAPSLTAAYIARRNPHMSVTLLHYGCSGGTIANGVLTPWAYLNTFEQVARRYWEGFRERLEVAPRDEHVARFPLHDVGPSQVDQAANDLAAANGVAIADALLLSVGGNDVGFADLVEAVLAPWRTRAYLKKEYVPDQRARLTFDEARWDLAAKSVSCNDNGVECLGQHVRQRLHRADSSLLTQYAALAEDKTFASLIGGDARRVFITAYPNFTKRSREDGSGPEADRDTVYCVDRIGDRRTDFVSGPIAPLVGMRRNAAEAATEYLFGPLNATIAAAAATHGWNYIDGHTRHGLANGYCSQRRYYNTFPDSYYNQGRAYNRTLQKPLGNMVIRDPPPGSGLRDNTPVIWDVKLRCFVEYRAMPAVCLQLETTWAQALPWSGGSDDVMADWMTNGPVHPNLFGHCNIAAAIINQLVQSNPARIPYEETLEREVREGGLRAEDICAASAWGFEASPNISKRASARRRNLAANR